MRNIKDASRQAVENVLSVAIENFYKPGVVDMLLSWHNAKSEGIKAYDDIIYINNDENINFILCDVKPAQVLRYTDRDYKYYDAFIMLDGRGYLISFHYDYFIDTYIKGDHDLIDYIVENVSVNDLDKLHALSLKDKNEILKEALINE
jgi:hypothetical protein